MNFNPGMLGFGPEQMQAAQEVGRLLKLEVHKCPQKGRVEFRYIAISPEDPRTQATINNCVDGLAMQMAMVHDTIFGMKGKIIQED
jgi:hypothetical protein